MQCTNKFLNLRTTYRILPSFSLEIDKIETEPVLIDDPINPLICSGIGKHSSIGTRSAVPHCQHQIKNQLFKELVTFSFLAEEIR